MASVVASGNRGGQSLVLNGVDPETCMIVFKNHWAQVVKILEKHDPLRGSGSGVGVGGVGSRSGPIPGDEASAVQNYVEHMLLLLMEEESGQGGAMGPILEFVVMENVMERLFVWSLRRDFTDDTKLEQLKMYEMLIAQARQPLLHHKPVLRPLVMLLSSCAGGPSPSPSGPHPPSSSSSSSSSSSVAVDAELVLLLNQLCCVLAREPSVLELFFHSSEDQGAANFLIFSLLIPFIHREGSVGQQARDALLLVMALSAENPLVAKHIAENTYFCPVLATGLSGLYSSLPTRLEVSSEDWHCLHRDDWQRIPALVQFLNSLEFCNAVMQVAHPSIRDQLVGYIHNGFLVPVLAPALHKLTVEEVMTTTAYLDLFIRSVTEPALLHTFLSFILLHRHDNVHILDTLVSRINTPFQLGTVSLALFRTLIGLYCEDVMLQLVLKYLIPCNHMMLSQRCVLKERDCYSACAARFLALTPSCCCPDVVPPPLRQLDSILWSKTSHSSGSAPTDLVKASCEQDNVDDDDSTNTCVIGSELYLDVSYLHYLCDAHNLISGCIRACRVWSAPYDGENPAPDSHPDSGRPRTSTTAHQKPSRPQVSAQTLNELVNAGPGVELEWDDSYDVGPAPTDPEEEAQTPVPVRDEPPKHIQELRRTAIMLVKGSYIEESEFQNDVMVYDLVALKDSKDSADKNSDKPKHDVRELDVDVRNSQSESSDQKSSVCNGLTERGPVAPDPGDDLMIQYEELLRNLVADSNGPTNSDECRNPVARVEEEEEEVDFSSFSAETPEPEKISSPFGNKPRSGSRNHAIPFTGPFVSVLLSRLENLLDNSLHVNLLLTSILAQLASFPQPLLRSFLLNTGVVLQPSVRSLYQVLASVKNQIELLTASHKDFPEMLTAAQQCLLARETSHRAQDSFPAGSNGSSSAERFSSPVQEMRMRMMNVSVQPKTVVPLERTELYGTVVFTEFLKELAALAQEHSILSHHHTEE